MAQDCQLFLAKSADIAFHVAGSICLSDLLDRAVRISWVLPAECEHMMIGCASRLLNARRSVDADSFYMHRVGDMSLMATVVRISPPCLGL